MHTKLMKLTVVLIAALVLLATAGTVSAGVGNFSINLSHGEITAPDGGYTGYIVFTPDEDYGLISSRHIIVSDDAQVNLSGFGEDLSGFGNLGELFTDYAKFSYFPSVASLNGQPANSMLMTLKGKENASLTAGTPYQLVPFIIRAGPTTNTTVNLTFETDSRDSYVANDSEETLLNNGLGGITKVLSNETPNSIYPESVVYVDIETNETVFDGNVSVFSELAKVIANSSDKYFLNYSSSNEDAIKFYNYNNASLNMTPRYVVLKGSNYSVITVNLTTNTTPATVIDSKTFTVQTKKIDITKEMFNFTANHTYGYSAGVSVASQVLDDVKKAFLNHSVGAADAGEDAAIYGYPRETGKITLTFFNQSGVEMDPIESDKYTFNISIAGNDNYNEVTDLQIDNNTFTISGAVIRGVSIPLNKSLFNATTPAKMTVEFNATGLDLNTTYYAKDTAVSEYIYFFAHYNLSYNSTNYPYLGVNCNVSDDNRSITFDNATIHPVQEVTYFDFVGFPRGDVNLDGYVDGEDATMLAIYLANISSPTEILTVEKKFYANVKGSEVLSGNDVRLIAQYASGFLTPDYLDLQYP